MKRWHYTNCEKDNGFRRAERQKIQSVPLQLEHAAMMDSEHWAFWFLVSACRPTMEAVL